MIQHFYIINNTKHNATNTDKLAIDMKLLQQTELPHFDMNKVHPSLLGRNIL